MRTSTSALAVVLNSIATCLLISAIVIAMNHYSTSHASPLPLRVTQVPSPVMKPLPDIKPEHRKTEWKWLRMFSQINRRMQRGRVDIVFLGDSLTQGWNNNPTWKVFYGNRRAVNAGIWADRTQHLLWRMQHGNLAGIEPKVVVLQIGGNNLMMESPRQVAGGIRRNIEEIRKKLPRTKILLVGILPAGRDKTHPRRARGKRVNNILANLALGKRVVFVDIWQRLLTKDGRFEKKISKDGLHLTRLGYAIYARVMEPKISAMLGQTAIVAGRSDLPKTKKGATASRSR